MPGDWHVRFLRGPGVARRRAYLTQAVARCSLHLTRDEVMTAREVADLLKMPVSTIYELARRGELPARRLGADLAVPAAGA
jgi:excisionase family DNA binding protein